MDSRLNQSRPSTPIDDFSDSEVLFLNNKFLIPDVCMRRYIFRHFVSFHIL